MATPVVAVGTAPTVHTLPGTANIVPAQFPAPEGEAVGGDADPLAEAEKMTGLLNDSFGDATFQATQSLFAKNGFWRDHLALSWSFRTVQGRAKIGEFLTECARSRDGLRIKHVAVDAGSAARQPAVAPLDGEGRVAGITAFLSVETVLGGAEGLMRLAREDGQWKIFTMYTSLRSLKGHTEGTFSHRPLGVLHGAQPGRRNWAEARAAAAAYGDGSEPAVLIIDTATCPGAGQAGLTAAARLKALGVDALVVDRNDRIGDNWRRRYHHLVLHDPVWYDHLPYLSFPPQWPVFTPKDKLAQWFEAYAAAMELNVWTRARLAGASWDDAQKRWTVHVERESAADGSVERRTLHPRHIIQATGHSGEKSEPAIKGTDAFRGDRICHSSEFPGARPVAPGAGGRTAVVVGGCNSALDIAQDFAEKGYDVTVVQRSSTLVVSSRAVTDIALGGLYSEGGPPVEDADLLVQSMPNSVLKALQVKVAEAQRRHDRDMLQGLAGAGFKLDDGPDGAGLFFKYFQRGGGYYIDVGAARLIAEGSIKVKQGVEVAEILPDGLRLSDQSRLKADEIVLATGFRSMRSHARQMFGDAVADKVHDVWGLNEEGEWRTMWQRSGYPGFWFHGGNLGLCRYYSLLLALQIKAMEEHLYDYDEN
ncbi:flavin-containing monooxygenase [Metarhizium album ARSEF 1941]|uniref:Flavin-containing monooxygenase n=1 Tax=Metarhizium album (strain ARSEF 1941) TaxID=1081103 RepID=A0A0B2WL53_METAS|nr:flavin-containing monooxygenase [Metarhizium album ARSEF 1941]KHN94424.1 flavin-containing monooxygenase [Metarhizium album ARSEF 1941]